MGILSVTKARFTNSNTQSITLVKVADPLHDLFSNAFFNLMRNLNNSDSDQLALRIRASALFSRVSSFVADDLNSVHYVNYLKEELGEFTQLASQFEGVEKYAETIKKTIGLMQERRTNYKREAISDYMSQSRKMKDLVLLTRGHNWRTLEISFNPIPLAKYSAISFDTENFRRMESVLSPMSPNRLSKKLQKEIFFSGLADRLIIFLYKQEKLRLPDIPIFIASIESEDAPLISIPEITVENFIIEEKRFVEGSPEEAALEDDECLVDSERALKLLLNSNEEIYLRPWDYVWCDDHGELSHLPAAEMDEGMRLLLRADIKVEKPEEYLDRSEVWRTPLRNLVNLGIPCDLIATNIEYKAGVTVTSRMVRSWVNGTVLGPEAHEVFIQVIKELKRRGHLDRSISESEVQSWWHDLEHTRMAQTSKGLNNRSETLRQAEQALAEDAERDQSSASLFEFVEVLVIEHVWIGSTKSDSIGVSNHRNVRVFS